LNTTEKPKSSSAERWGGLPLLPVLQGRLRPAKYRANKSSSLENVEAQGGGRLLRRGSMIFGLPEGDGLAAMSNSRQ
jgi:hypothetical protein